MKANHLDEMSFLRRLAGLSTCRRRIACAEHTTLTDIAKADAPFATAVALALAAQPTVEPPLSDPPLSITPHTEDNELASAVLSLATWARSPNQPSFRAVDVGAPLTALPHALPWFDSDVYAPIAANLLNAVDVTERLTGLEASVRLQADPGYLLSAALEHDDTRVVAAAARAAGMLGRSGLRPTLEELLRAPQLDTRFWAAWSCVRLGDRGRAFEMLKSYVYDTSDLREQALMLIARVLPDLELQRWLNQLARNAVTPRDIVLSIGAAGEPTHIPILLAAMQNPEESELASLTFGVVTGAAFDLGSTSNDGATMAAAWWRENSGKFRRGTRYLAGKPINADQCLDVLKYGPQAQRSCAALELALIQTGMPLFDIEAPAMRQYAALGVTADIGSSELDETVKRPVMTATTTLAPDLLLDNTVRLPVAGADDLDATIVRACPAP